MKQEVILGSGDLYIKLFEGSIPDDKTLEVEENKIAGIKGGAKIGYSPEIYAVVDDNGIVHKSFVTDSEVTFTSGILTWNLEVLEKISLCGEFSKTSEKATLKLGGRGAIKNYIVRFVHTKDDGLKCRTTIVGTASNGFEIAFNPSEETVIDAEFTAGTLDSKGNKLILEEELQLPSRESKNK